MVFCKATFHESIFKSKEFSILVVFRTEYFGLSAGALYFFDEIGKISQLEEVKCKISFANSYQLHDPLLQKLKILFS